MLKLDGHFSTQFGISSHGGGKVSRSLFPSVPCKSGHGKKGADTPNSVTLSSTEEVLKHWTTERLLEQERLDRLEHFEKIGDADNLSNKSNVSEAGRQTRVKDIFDQCLKHYTKPTTSLGKRKRGSTSSTSKTSKKSHN